MSKVTEAQIKDMKRIILIAENCEPLFSKISRRYITITDNAKEHIRSAATAVAMLHGAMRR